MTPREAPADRGPASGATVFVVDDDPQVREALLLLMESVDLPVEVFESAEEFLSSYSPDRPGCLILDVRMPGMSGLRLQRRLSELGMRIPTLILTAYAEVPVAVEAFRAGALDFLEKPYSPQELIDRVHEALRADAQVRRRQARQEELRELFESLTARECEVLEGIATGKNSKQIADGLGITRVTVDFHRRNLQEKMGVRNSVELGRFIEAHLGTRGATSV